MSSKFFNILFWCYSYHLLDLLLIGEPSPRALLVTYLRSIKALIAPRADETKNNRPSETSDGVARHFLRVPEKNIGAAHDRMIPGFAGERLNPAQFATRLRICG